MMVGGEREVVCVWVWLGRGVSQKHKIRGEQGQKNTNPQQCSAPIVARDLFGMQNVDYHVMYKYVHIPNCQRKKGTET